MVLNRNGGHSRFISFLSPLFLYLVFEAPSIIEEDTENSDLAKHLKILWL